MENQNKIENQNTIFFKDYNSFSEYLKENKPTEETLILIKGSRGMALERTLEIL